MSVPILTALIAAVPSTILIIIMIINMFSTQFYRSREESSSNYRDILKELSSLNIKTATIDVRIDHLSKKLSSLNAKQL